ncbi:MAG: flagellar hook-basal body complex protein FliE [Hyphomonadaceae bacterium]
MSDLGLSAVRAYGQATASLAGKDAAPAAEGPSFGDILGKAAGAVQNAGSTAEGAIVGAAMGNADMVDVVTAVAAAEASLETVMAVRDEVIRAYQDIMRMPI